MVRKASRGGADNNAGGAGQPPSVIDADSVSAATSDDEAEAERDAHTLALEKRLAALEDKLGDGAGYEPLRERPKFRESNEGIPGLKRFSKRLSPLVEDGEAEPGEYVALQVIGIPNPKFRPIPKFDPDTNPEEYRTALLREQFDPQTERPCVYLNPKDVFKVPETISGKDAYPLKQAGIIRKATESDLEAIEIEEGIAYERSTIGGIPRPLGT